MTTAPVALYTRISFDPFDQQAGVERQRADTAEIAARRWPERPTKLYEDNDRSATRGPRPAFDALMLDIEAGEVSAVVAWNQDRFLRQPRELEAVIDLCDKMQFRDLVTAEGDIDLTTHDGRFRARILAAVAIKSSDDKSRRVKRAVADRREKGHKIAGKLPYGVASWVDADITIDAGQAAIIREAADRLCNGHSLRSITSWAHEMDAASPKSQPGWRDLLLSTRALDGPVAADVRAILCDPSRLRGSRGARTQWLTGILYCGVCGSEDIALQSNARAYRCPNANHLSASQTPLEHAIEIALFSAVVVEPEPEPEPEPVDPHAAERMAVLAAMYARDELTRDEWLAAREPLAALLDRPAPARRRAPKPVPNLSAEWPSMDPLARHQAASALLSRVDVLPASRPSRAFDPGRLRYTWRR